VGVNPYRVLVKAPEGPSEGRILVVEPSPFRRAETRVMGPYGRVWAWLMAHWVVRRHPYGEVQVVDARCRGELGSDVLWDGIGV
jgi:hypothetical protein